MKLLTSLLFLLITSTYAARLSIDVFPSSHKLQANGQAPSSGNPAKGCLIPHLGRCGTCSDSSIKKQLKCTAFCTYINDMFNILWYIKYIYICMLNAFVHDE